MKIISLLTSLFILCLITFTSYAKNDRLIKLDVRVTSFDHALNNASVVIYENGLVAETCRIPFSKHSCELRPNTTYRLVYSRKGHASKVIHIVTGNGEFANSDKIRGITYRMEIDLPEIIDVNGQELVRNYDTEQDPVATISFSQDEQIVEMNEAVVAYYEQLYAQFEFSARITEPKFNSSY